MVTIPIHSEPTPTGILAAHNFGATGDGTTDDTGAIIDFMEALATSESKRGYIRTGTYRITSALPAITASGTNIFGDSSYSTFILRDCNGSGNRGIFDIAPGAWGVNLSNMNIRANPGNSGGAAISCIADASGDITGTSKYLTLENLVISPFANTDGWDHSLYIDGSLNATGVKGIEGMSLKNVVCYGSADYSVILKSVVALEWFGGGIYSAGGTAANSGNLLITGISGNESSQFRIDVNAISRGVSLDRCERGVISALYLGNYSGNSVINTANVNNIRITGDKNGTVQNNWVDSSWSW